MRLRPHRRAVLAGIGATLALPRLQAQAATAPVTYKVGAIDVSIVSDGVLNVPLSFLLPETPSPEAAALFKAHGLPEHGRPPQTNVVLVKTGDERILIDAGSGPGFQPTAGKLQENLEAAGHRARQHHQDRVHPRSCRSPVGRDRRFRRWRPLSECALRDLGCGMGFLDQSGHRNAHARCPERHGARIEPHPQNDREEGRAPQGWRNRRTGTDVSRDARAHSGPHGGSGRETAASD